MVLYYKYGQIFRDVIRVPPLQICSLFRDLKQNPLSLSLGVRTLVDVINSAAPNLIHECPYNVSYIFELLFLHWKIKRQGLFVKNASWAMDDVPSIFASGEYKMFFNGTIKNEFAGTVSVIAIVNSTNKDTFGWPRFVMEENGDIDGDIYLLA